VRYQIDGIFRRNGLHDCAIRLLARSFWIMEPWIREAFDADQNDLAAAAAAASIGAAA
jgi:hypothetical protein